jgi:2-hydroxychromene-2-carboxylate isomerase
MAHLEFLFDVASPYSYLASTQLRGLQDRTGCDVQITPILLGGILKALGNQPVPPAPRLNYMRRDLAAWGKRYGVPVEIPPSFPVKTVLPLRAIIAAGPGEDGRVAMHALFRTFWGEGKDVSDPEIVKASLTAAGLDGAALVAKAEDPAVKDQLRANTERAVDRGVFGAPTFFVGGYLFWGNDRLDFVEDALLAK